MEQLNLTILPQIVYRPEHFMLHAGVSRAFEESAALLTHSGYSAAFFYGIPRAGKTHFVISLAAALGSRGFFPRIVEGTAFANFLSDESVRISFGREDVIIVDDANRYFSEIIPGQSGPFVQFIERLRGAGAHFGCTSSVRVSEFPCDAHIKSRLIEAAPVAIDGPDEESVPQLLERMARQRGIQLSNRKIDFVERRLGRSVASIESYLEKVVHLSSVLGRKVSLTLLGDAL